MNIGIILVATLILVSGLVAFIGNLVGRGIGRRRLTLFGLRPRYTAQIITILTGMLITVVTLAVVLLVSNDVRQALFHFQEQIAEKEAQLNALLRQEIVYLKDQEILRAVIDGRAPVDTVKRQVQAFLDLAAQEARQRGIVPADGVTVHISPPGLTADSLAQDIAERSQPMVIRMIATENTVKGFPLNAGILVFPDALVFSEGQMIASRVLDGRASREQIEAGLLNLGASVVSLAKERGVISPPFALTTAPPDVRTDPAILLQTLDRVQASRAPVEVRAVALVNTYTIGPVQLTFR